MAYSNAFGPPSSHAYSSRKLRIVLLQSQHRDMDQVHSIVLHVLAVHLHPLSKALPTVHDW